jgi:hypothetical protein
VTTQGYITSAALAAGNANVTAANSRITAIDANIGAYQIWANANIAGLSSNAGTQATSINRLDANIGAYQIWANTSIFSRDANLGTVTTNITTLDANLGVRFTTLNTLHANVGAYQTWANSRITAIDGNIGTLSLGNISTQANLGAYQTYANTTNATTQANIGAFYNYANTKIGTNTNSNLVVVATTSSTNTTTGALVVRGGAGIAGAVNIGTSLTVDGGAYGNVATTQFASVYGQAYGPNPYSIMQVRSNDFTTGMGIQTYAGLNGLLYSNTGIQFNTGSNVRDKDFPTGGINAGQFAANGAFIALTGIASTSTGTGAVIVTGGVGIAGNTNIGDNIAVGANLTVSQSGLFRGPYDENSILSGVFVGNTGTAPGVTPRVGFFNGNTQQNWQIDNNAGAFRWFVPGSTKMTLYDTGNLNITGGYTVGGKKAVNGPAFSAYANATPQTITTGSQQKVLFQTEEFDTDNCYANSRFTPNVEGYYQLNAEVRLDGVSGTGEMMIVIYKNTTEHKRGTNQQGTQIAANFWAMTVSSLVYANGTTDYFEIRVQQGSGGNVTVTAVNSPNITWFNGAMLRGA